MRLPLLFVVPVRPLTLVLAPLLNVRLEPLFSVERPADVEGLPMLRLPFEKVRLPFVVVVRVPPTELRPLPAFILALLPPT